MPAKHKEARTTMVPATESLSLRTLSVGALLVLAGAWGCASNGNFGGDDWTPGPKEPSVTNEPNANANASAGPNAEKPKESSAPVAGNGDAGAGSSGTFGPSGSVDSGASGSGEMDASGSAGSSGSPGGMGSSSSSGGSSGAMPVVCTSGNRTPPAEGLNMAPGRACGGCHANTFAGTVYPTLRELNDCRGSDGKSVGAKVVITGANGKTANIPVSNGGNFYANMAGVTLPYSVKVVVGTTERVMSSKTSSGDCNRCHTQEGKSGAPGRVMMPQ